ncbi:MAG: PP2C family protein-serine/threonine phosphatase [Nakamurella sp.]
MRDYGVAAVGRTHVGLVKPNNEDSFHIGSGLLIVADGVGGSAAGEVASRTVVDIFAEVENESAAAGEDKDIYALLNGAVDRSTDSLLSQVDADPRLEGMGTTVTAMMWSGRRIVFAQIGDSRAYYLQSGAPGAPRPSAEPLELQQVTKDDSFVQYLVDQGLLAKQDAARHPRRNVILKALNGTTVSPSFSTFAPRIGDRYLLCSDGLSDYVAADDIRASLLDTAPAFAADRLIELCLESGAPDNVTVIIADVVAAD